jgi:hypothetical protein
MGSIRFGTPFFYVLLVIAAGLIGCRHAAAPPGVESYTPTEASVGFDIMRLGSPDGSPRWLATYTDGERTTRFSIELGDTPTADGKSSPAVGKGRFVAETDSDPLPLLDHLKKALQAKRMPSHVQKVDALSFDYLLLGENQSRTSGGGFSPNPRGNWTVMKIFLANDQAEVYFNFNPVIHKAEFSIKDAGYGDRVLAELAKVF